MEYVGCKVMLNLSDMMAAQSDTSQIALKLGHWERKRCTEAKTAIQAVLRM